ncbi:MAG: hypothetical protein HY360_26445 [Verrucomicrobia bacterium]|nr:hypothetical protein [Verrucomicrobiota bacterium]
MTTAKAMAARIFTGESLAQVAFPLGGIGTGTVSMGGRGNLQDWEIFNRPNKGSQLPMTFLALRAEPQGRPAVSRILEREYLPPFTGGGGFPRHALAGVSRFSEVTFRGEYPFAWLKFKDRAMPVEVSLEAFNPFIPMNVEDSSIPGAILRYVVRNPQKVSVNMSLLAVMNNPVGQQSQESTNKIEETLNVYREEGGLRGIFFSAPGLPWNDVNFGTATLSTDWADTDCQTQLYRGGWWDSAHVLWDEFTATGRLAPQLEPRHGRPLAEGREKKKNESGAICLRCVLKPGEERRLTVFIHWHFPHTRLWGGNDTVLVRIYTANQFTDAWDAAMHTVNHLPRLEAETRRWHSTLFESTLPAEVRDAVSSQMSILRTPTCLRLSDGNFYAWEGCSDQHGCCAGNCTHVWNYEQALAFLFPSLERTMRRIDFGPNMRPNGAMAFRCCAPSGVVNSGNWVFHACADGQMGNIIQVYRDWQLSGDDSFLRELWPNVKKTLEYAWTEPNGWDPDKDGVIEGCQHNTYDIEFYGPNMMIGSLYLGALRAAEEMAKHLGEADKAREYRGIYEKGRARMEKELWNGEYFIQKVEVMPGLRVPDHLRSPEGCCDGGCACKPRTPEDRAAASSDGIVPKYQYGEGCLSDQLLGQWAAHVAGLGHVLDPEKTRAAARAIFRHNFRDPIGGFDNVQRVYALQDEAGLLLCSWPKGNRPALPFVYSDEVWTGIEYQVAAHLIYEGLVEEGLAIVKAVRARHDGVRRNPWDEFECGHHYARALSSWSLIQALSGARYSAVEQSLVFNPRLKTPFRCVFAAGSAWGILRLEKTKATLEVRHGSLRLKKLGVANMVREWEPARRLSAGESVSVP